MGIGNIANTGINAAMTDMDVISNNIANANTPGFKRSSASFSDIYSFNGGASTNQAGIGVQLNGIHQDFTAGGSNYTNNPLDLKIQDNGFFVLKDPGTGLVSYSRAGSFMLDGTGFITNGHQRLQGFPATNGVIVGGASTTDLQIGNTPLNATASSTVFENLNLSSTSSSISATFDKNDVSTYNYTTTANIFDSLGNQHALSLYFVKTASNTWTAQALVDGTSVGTGSITFNPDGSLNAVTGLSALSFAPGTGATSPQVLAVDLTGTTQYASDSSERACTNNGFNVGTLNGYQVDNNGNVIASYSNGQSKILGQVAIAHFQSPENLSSIGNMSWIATSASGLAVVNPSNSANDIIANTIETSNVDLTQEMINLITAQHNFQANTQVVKTYNEVMQIVIQL